MGELVGIEATSTNGTNTEVELDKNQDISHSAIEPSFSRPICIRRSRAQGHSI
jgi:hypothetical protein